MGWRAVHNATSPQLEALYSLIVTDISVTGVNLGNLLSGITQPSGIAYGDGRWLVVDIAGGELWRINPDNPLDETGVYGLVGEFPSGITFPSGIAFGDGRWLVVDSGGDELWRINPDDPDDVSGVFGLVGNLPSGITSPRGIGYGNGRWLVVDDTGDELWRINPDNPLDETGVYGLVGEFAPALSLSSGIAYGDGRWLVVDDSGNELWRINPDNSLDETGVYGLVGVLPAGLTTPLGLGYEPEIPDAEAPTVVINNIPIGDEGTDVQLSAVLTDGIYDEVDYLWSSNGGAFDDPTLPSPILTRPLVASQLDRTARLDITARGTGTLALVNTEDTSFDTQVFTVRNVPTVVTNIDSVWQLAAQEIMSLPAPAGGIGSENHDPAGWSRVELDPTNTSAVWRSQRTRTYQDGVFTSATVWGLPIKIADRLITEDDFVVPDGREADFICLIRVDGGNNIYSASGGNGEIVSGDLSLDDIDAAFNRIVRIATLGSNRLRFVRSGAASLSDAFVAGGDYETANFHFQATLDSSFVLDNSDINRLRANDIRFDLTASQNTTLVDQVDGDLIIIALTREVSIEAIESAFDASIGIPSATIKGRLSGGADIEGAFNVLAGIPSATIRGRLSGGVDIEGAFNALAGIPSATIQGFIRQTLSIRGAFNALAGIPSATIKARLSTIDLEAIESAFQASAGVPFASIVGQIDDEEVEVIGSEGVWFNGLLGIELSGQTLFLSTLSYDVSFEGDLYIGSKVLNISSAGQSNLVSSGQISISIVNIQPEDRAIFRETRIGSPIIVMQLIASVDGGLSWSKVGRTIKGNMSSPRIQGGTFSFNVILRNIAANLGQVRYWSHADRIRRFGLIDQGMSQMPLFDKKQVLGSWPQV